MFKKAAPEVSRTQPFNEPAAIYTTHASAIAFPLITVCQIRRDNIPAMKKAQLMNIEVIKRILASRNFVVPTHTPRATKGYIEQSYCHYCFEHFIAQDIAHDRRIVSCLPAQVNHQVHDPVAVLYFYHLFDSHAPDSCRCRLLFKSSISFSPLVIGPSYFFVRSRHTHIVIEYLLSLFHALVVIVFRDRV